MPIQTTLTDINQDVRALQAAAVPLTTVWTAPSDCPSIYIPDNDGYESCQPPKYQNAWDHGGHWSPGICPSGYTVGCTYSGTTIQLNSNTMRNRETAGLCVPSSWVCWEETSTKSGSRVIIRAKFASTDGMSTEVPPWSRAPAWEIRWQSSDLAEFETPPIAALAQSTLPATPGSSITGDAPTATVTVVSEGGLSAGAIAGIAVGSAFLSLLMVGVAILLWKRSRARARSQADVQGSAAPAHEPYVAPDGIHEADGRTAVKAHAVHPHRGPAPMTHEMGDLDPPMAELATNKEPSVVGQYELGH